VINAGERRRDWPREKELTSVATIAFGAALLTSRAVI
jgi:hypothetical protein